MAGLGGKREGAGRKKGVPNKQTRVLKDMILMALDGVGGQEYLEKQAKKNPTAFMTLLGKVLPAEIKATHEGKVGFTIEIVKFGDTGPTEVTDSE